MVKKIKNEGRDSTLLSVIIPTYNAGKTIERCLSAIFSNTFKDIEVIIVDDCSTDGTLEVIKRLNYPFRLFRLERNSGPATARNLGAKNAKSDILFFIDSDVILLENTLKEVYDSYKEGVVAVIGMYAKEPANNGFFQSYMTLWKYYTWMFPKPPKYFSFFIASCGSIKKKIFNEIKGFNTNYKGADVEDYEFGHNLTKNHKIVFNPKIQGKHYHPSFKSSIKNYYKRSSQWFKLFLKRKRFDTGAASASRGISSMTALLALMLLILSLLHPLFSAAALFFLMVFIMMNAGFYLFTLKEKSVTFMLGAIITSYILAFAISLGVVRSIIKFPFEK